MSCCVICGHCDDDVIAMMTDCQCKCHSND